MTASHNPLEWNGLKFIIDGRGLFEHELEEMLKMTSEHRGIFGNEFKIYSRYLEDVAEMTKRGTAAVKVGIDAGGGGAWLCRTPIQEVRTQVL